MTINLSRLQNRMNQVNQIGKLPGGGVSRLALSDEDKLARNYLIDEMKKLGLEVKVDEIGNVFGILKGKNESFIGAGSHLDTVPTGGCFDGTLGVLAALEVAETFLDSNYQPNNNLVVCNFTNEEGVRFTPDMMGSMAHANPMMLTELLKSKSEPERITLEEALKNIGFKGSLPCGSINFKYFVELHIEQGPILEKEGLDIGVVQEVQGIHWVKLILQGVNAHAGTTPMHLRKDPFHPLVDLSIFLKDLTLKEPELKVTTGSIKVEPNAINIIPEKIEATFDIRHPDLIVFNEVKNKFYQFIETSESFKPINTNYEILVDIEPIMFNTTVVETIEKSAKTLNYSYKRMYSGAGHDAQLLSSRYPSAMIFIPSIGGVSHTIHEYSDSKQVEKGANVLLHAILDLDQMI